MNVGFYVSETCELIEMSSKSVSRVIESLVTCTYKAASFDQIMSLVKGGSAEIFIDGMDLKLFERIDGSDSMLPNISNNIIEIACFEHIDRIR